MHIVKCAQPAGRLRKVELSMKEGFLEIKELKKVSEQAKQDRKY